MNIQSLASILLALAALLAIGCSSAPPQTTPPDTDSACSVEACGPALGMPEIPCDDGSMAGSTGNCIRQASGECGWEVLECPSTGGDLDSDDDADADLPEDGETLDPPGTPESGQ